MKKNKNIESVKDITFSQKVSKRKKQKKVVVERTDEDKDDSNLSLLESLDDDYSDLGYYKDIYNSMRDW
jgi:hypothetical protein